MYFGKVGLTAARRVEPAPLESSRRPRARFFARAQARLEAAGRQGDVHRCRLCGTRSFFELCYTLAA